MQPMSTIRGWQIDQLRKAVPMIKRILDTTSVEDATTYRDGGNGWTVLEVMCHLRDYEPLFIERAQLTLEQDFPPLPNPDPDQLVIDNQYSAQDLQEVYAEWAQSRGNLVALYESLEGDDIWERPANHPRRGRFTLNDQLLLTVWHDTNHIEQMVKILEERT